MDPFESPMGESDRSNGQESRRTVQRTRRLRRSSSGDSNPSELDPQASVQPAKRPRLSGKDMDAMMNKQPSPKTKRSPPTPSHLDKRKSREDSSSVVLDLGPTAPKKRKASSVQSFDPKQKSNNNKKLTNEVYRATLVDWLVDVHCHTTKTLTPSALHLAVHLVDCYMSSHKLSPRKLQLLGATCLWIACKYHEDESINLSLLVYLCDGAYEHQDFIEMEEEVLGSLLVDPAAPTAFVFLDRILRTRNFDQKVTQVSYYILDGTLLSMNLLQYPPSQLAAAALYLALGVVGTVGNTGPGDIWDTTLTNYTHYSRTQLLDVVRAIAAEKTAWVDTAPASRQLGAVTKKYSLRRFGAVAGTTSFDFDDDALSIQML